MKRLWYLVTILVTAGTMIWAQLAPAPQPSGPPAQATPATQNQPPQAPAPGQAGQGQPPAAAGQAAPGQTSPARAGRPQPQAKTQAEYDDWKQIAAMTDPAKEEAAVDAFAAKYPQSELTSHLYTKVMRDYQNADNADKTVEMGRKVISLDPYNPEALVTVATVLSEKTHESDLDRDQRLAEAVKDANLALEKVDTDLVIPSSVTPQQVEEVKSEMRSMAYAALGTVDLSKKNYPSAEQNLRKAVELNKAQPDPVTYLRLSVVLDQEKKYPDALDAANKAVQYAPEGSQPQNLAKLERDRLQKLVNPAQPPQ